MRENRQLEFINSNRSTIIKECLANESKTGYLQLLADSDFNLVEASVRFIEGDFNKDEFTDMSSDKLTTIDPDEIQEAIYVYYSILWEDDKTKWNVRGLALQVQ